MVAELFRVQGDPYDATLDEIAVRATGNPAPTGVGAATSGRRDGGGPHKNGGPIGSVSPWVTTKVRPTG